jgi:WD40 repeat protein
MEFGPTGLLATASMDSLRVWDVEGRAEIRVFPLQPSSTHPTIRWRRSGRALVAQTETGGHTVVEDFAVSRAPSGRASDPRHDGKDPLDDTDPQIDPPPPAAQRLSELLMRHFGPHNLVLDASLSPDGTWVAALTGDGSLTALEVPSGRERWHRRADAWQVRVAPNARLVAVGDARGTVSVLDAETGRSRGELGFAALPARDAAFAGDHLLVAEDFHVAVWSLSEARIVQRIPVNGLEAVGVDDAGRPRLVRRGLAGTEGCAGSFPIHYEGLDEVGSTARVPACLTTRVHDVDFVHARALVGTDIVDLKTGTLTKIDVDLAFGPWPLEYGSEFFSPGGAWATTVVSTPTFRYTYRIPFLFDVSTGRIPRLGPRAAGSDAGAPDPVLSALGEWIVHDLGTFNSDGPTGLPASVDNPAVSADGKRFAFTVESASVMEMPGPSSGLDTDGAEPGPLAYTPSGELVVSSADGRLFVFAGGRERVRIASDGGAVRRLRLDGAGKLAAAVGVDGAVRVFDLTTGTLRAMLADFADGEYVAATPAGAFTGTSEVGERVGWVFDDPEEYFRFEQLSAAYRRDDLVRARLAGQPIDLDVRLERPPSVEVPDAPRSTPGASVKLRVRTASGARVDTVRAYVDGTPAAAVSVCAKDAESVLDVPLRPGTNRIAISAFDARGQAGNPALLDIVSSAPGARPDLWVIGVGVSRYPHLPAGEQLAFADADVESVAAAMASQAGPGRPFATAHVQVLTNESVTPAAATRALGALSAMGPDDLAVVALAGHGAMLSDASDMVFLTSGAAPTARSVAEQGIGWSSLQAALGAARGRVVVLVDACHSGHISQDLVVPNDRLAAALARSGRAGVVVFAASKGRQASWETARAGGGSDEARSFVLDARGLPFVAPPPGVSAEAPGHGVFSAAVLASLFSPNTDADGDGVIELSELLDDVTYRVTRASGGEQTPWVARRELFGDFGIAAAPGH